MKVSTSWKSSKKPKKQRKYLYNVAIHARVKLLAAHLSEELSKKFGKRSVTVRKGDKVKIMKGQFKDRSGKIELVDSKKRKVTIEGIEYQKKDGTKVKFPVYVSNLMITELDLSDKKRQESLKRK